MTDKALADLSDRCAAASGLAVILLALSGCGARHGPPTFPYADVTCERGGRIIFQGVVENAPARDLFGDGMRMTSRGGDDIILQHVDSCRARRVRLPTLQANKDTET